MHSASVDVIQNFQNSNACLSVTPPLHWKKTSPGGGSSRTGPMCAVSGEESRSRVYNMCQYSRRFELYSAFLHPIEGCDDFLFTSRS